MSARTLNITAAALALLPMTTREAIDARLSKAGIDLPAETPDQVAAETFIKTSGVKSQGDLTAVYLNVTVGEGLMHTAENCTELLRAGFPDAAISKRHGPHYISHARTGKLKLLDEGITSIPHARKVKATKPEVEKTVAEQINDEVRAAIELRRAQLAELSRKDLVKAAKEAGVKANGKNDELIERILAA